MTPLETNASLLTPPSGAEELYDRICSGLLDKGYCIVPDALPMDVSVPLLSRVVSLNNQDYQTAGTGREQQHQVNHFVRRDQIHWLDDQQADERLWINWINGLKDAVNRRLMLGLFSYESHFARYEPGAFYKKHVDAFKGSKSRVLSTVLYLNPQWQDQDGGEFVLYDEHNHDKVIETVLPRFATLAVFLSEDFPHEVLPANRTRYSIAGWFRVNGSVGNVIDPPR